MTTSKKEKEREKRLYKTYGMTLGGFNSRLDMQGGGCWICERKDGRLCVDHRHIPKYKQLPPDKKLQECRGILCFMCNTMLHGVEKRKNARYFLKRMNEYFDEYKMKGDE